MKRIATALGVALMALATIQCGGGGDTATEADTIKIGAYLSLTGLTATFGVSTRHGVEMAVDEINAAGGINGRTIEIYFEDTQSKPEEAPSAVNKLIAAHNVSAIIGEIASSRTLAAAPIAQASGVPMVTPGSTNPQVTEVGDYIFRVCYIDPFQGEVLAKFIANSLGATRVAVLRDVKNDYSVGLAQYFTETFESLGGEIVANQAYSEGDADFKAQLTAIRGTDPEVIFVPGYYTESALIVKQARELNLNMPIVGGDGWDSSKLLEIGGDAMENTYFTNHYAADDTTAVVQQFVARYAERFDQSTPDAMAVLGYDAAKILFDAIRRAGSDDRTAIRDALAQTRDFPGVAGVTTIDENRNAKKSAVIIQVKDGALRYYETVNPD